MLPRPLLARLHATTGGNAFYALEIAGALDVRDAAVRPGAPLPVPATLQELVSQRLGRLPTPARETLLAVSALAQPRSSVLVDWAGSGDRVARDLGRARRAGVIELDDDRIRFSHPLLGSGLYAQTDASARRRMHGELARVVSDPEERVRHLARACAGPDPAVVAALEQAAERAQARGAPDAALELLDEAIRLTTNEQTTELARLALRAAEAAHIVGDDARARAMLERVAAERSAGELRTRALVLLTRVVHDFEASARLMRDACAEGVDDLRLRSEIERNLAASVWATVEEVFVGLEHAQAAVRFAEQAGDEAAYSHAIAWLARLQSLAGLPVHEDLQARVEARPSLDEEPLRLVQGARFTWAEILASDDELTRASETLEGLRRQAATVGNFQALAPVLQLLALVLWRRGDWSTARRVAQEAVDNARASGDDSGLVPALGSLACVEAHLGNIESARDTTAEGIALVETTHFRYGELRLRHALGALELSLGAPETACEHLAGVASSRWAVGYRDPSLVRTVPDEVEGLVALGELQHAHDALTPFQRYAKMLNRRWALGTAARCQGLLAAATGNQSAASEAFEHALELQRQLPEPYELARTLLTYGVARRRAKSRGEARELLEEAAKIFERLGGRIWAERARREIGRAGGRRGPRDELTATERRVAELVAEGRTNKAVAGELFMSVKTVEGNLSRVYRKLGVSSRTQLARRLRKPQDS
jgi:DNA-binding CsgD family transcriptional regulator